MRFLLLILGVCVVGFGCSDPAPQLDGSTVADSRSLDASAALDQPTADAAAADFQGADQSADQSADLGPPDAYSPPTLGKLTLHINLGDSIAAGYGVQESFADLLVKNNDSAYPAFIKKDLNTLFPGIKSYDAAYQGASSGEMKWQVQNAPTNLTGNTLVTFSVGGNDLLNNYEALLDPQKVKAQALSTINNIKGLMQHFADPKSYPNKTFFVMLNVYDPTDNMGSVPPGTSSLVINECQVILAFLPLAGAMVVQHLGIFNQELQSFAFATPGVNLADIHLRFLGHGYNFNNAACPSHNPGDPTLWFSDDCIHPNQRGQHEIRAAVWEQLFGP